MDDDATTKKKRQQKLAAVIDLRNADEIKKGKKQQSEGSQFFYSSLKDYSSLSSYYPQEEEENDNTKPILYHAPFLNDINSFWEEAISRLDTTTRIQATLATAFQGGALDRAAARYLETRGLCELYTIMLCTGGKEISRALQLCTSHVQEGGVIMFHCQKGKDRTGILSMLLQYACGVDEQDIITSYSLSGDLLGGEDAASSTTTKKSSSSSSTMLDWSRFRGSPSHAMADTIQWIKDTYGSVEGYMDYISFDVDDRMKLKRGMLK